jgi:acyl carrier protein
VAVQLDISEKDLDIDENIVDLGADLFDIIEIVLEVEEEFGIDVDLPDKEIGRLKTARDIAKYISQFDSKKEGDRDGFESEQKIYD